MDAPTTLASPLESRGLRWAIDAARVLAPFAAALLVGAIILWATGRNAIETYRLLKEPMCQRIVGHLLLARVP